MSHVKMPLTPKIGIPEEDKFSSWSAPHGTYLRDSVAPNYFKTDKMLSNSISKQDLLESITVMSQLYKTNKNQVEFKGRKTTPGSLSSSGSFATTTLSRSNTMESFVDYKSSLNLMKEVGTSNNFARSFQKYLKTNNNQDNASQEVISLFDTDLVVRDCLGENAPEFIVEKFKELNNSVAVHGEVTWDGFDQIRSKVIQAIEAECARHRDPPPLLTLMNQPKIVDRNLVSLGENSTTYRDNFNRTGDIHYRAQSETFRFDKVQEVVGSDMDKAARVLAAGTTKVTHHVPGYRGHIPANVRNERKLEHAIGKQAKAVQNDLVLTQRGMGCVLGYTGYVPVEFNGPRLERRTSCDPRTSNGAAYNLSGTRSLI